jgi:hypothetical protein
MGQMAFAVEGCAHLLDRNQLIENAATGSGDKSKFFSVVNEGVSEDARFLKQFAVEVERRDHVAGVVDDRGQAFTLRAKGGKGVHEVVDLLLFSGA